MSNYEDQVREVLLRASQPSGVIPVGRIEHEANGSTSGRLRIGEWLLRTNTHADEEGRRYFSTLVLSKKDERAEDDKAIWLCHYAVDISPDADPDDVLDFHADVCMQPEPEFPLGGPWDFEEDGREYHLRKGHEKANIGLFLAVETIAFNGIKVYEGAMHGGLINPRPSPHLAK